MIKKRYAMVIDTRTCIGCADCVVACKIENKVPEGYNRDWITEETIGKFPNLSMEIKSQRCNHCENPPCVHTCPTGASHIKLNTNITLVDPDLCTGCKACIAACPYDARFVHPEGYVSKCTFCDHRLDKGLGPACVESCPTHCMYFGNLNNPFSKVSRLLRSRKWKVIDPEIGTEPMVYYLL
ncbi:MAG: 4Fe-4S dicluster domain-containing protein [Halobacteriovoraceae bacterium]|jgi:Fe-S-cluster-containing dehydrogenase component|nr:4Fe-4S dicluster domain-containing protein [Halobacteriovoraceae bacterium]